MDYEIGVRMDTIAARLERLENGIEWLVKAMMDNGIGPKEEKENEESKSKTPFEEKASLNKKS